MEEVSLVLLLQQSAQDSICMLDFSLERTSVGRVVGDVL